MHQTLFYIPEQIFGIPVFGFGIVLVLWLVITGISLYFDYRKTGKKSVVSFATIVLLGCVAIIWVLPNIMKPSGLPIQSYGAMMLLGILSGVGLAIYRGKKYGYKSDIIISMTIWICVLGIIGARTFFCIEYWSEMKADSFVQTLRNCLSFTEGGLVVYGGFFGGLIGGLVFFWKTPNPNIETEKTSHLPVLRMLDIIAPSMVLGLAFGRIGCFLNGCCFGGVCDVDKYPWGVTFPAGSPPFMAQVDEGLIHLDNLPLQGIVLEKTVLSDNHLGIVVKSVQPGSSAEKAGIKVNDLILGINGSSVYDTNHTPRIDWAYYFLTAGVRQTGCVHITRFSAPDVQWRYEPDNSLRSLPVHPTQLYSVLNALIILTILLIFDRFRHWEGAMFALLLTIYPITRWILEAIRIDESGFMGTTWSISQIVSLVLLICVLGLWIYLWRANREVQHANN